MANELILTETGEEGARLDIHLPDISGVEALQRLRNDPVTRPRKPMAEENLER